MTHAYFNGPCVFLRVHGQEHVGCDLEILPPPQHGKDWRVVTAMRNKSTGRYAFGEYQADDYDHLVDSPFLLGALTSIPCMRFPFLSKKSGPPADGMPRLTSAAVSSAPKKYWA